MPTIAFNSRTKCPSGKVTHDARDVFARTEQQCIKCAKRAEALADAGVLHARCANQQKAERARKIALDICAEAPATASHPTD